MRKAIGCWMVVVLAAVGTGARGAEKTAAVGEGAGVAAGVGLKVGTTGLGGELTVGLMERLNVRGGFYFLSYNEKDREVEDIEYDVDLALRSQMVLLDVHPFGGGFRLSGGLVFNQHELELDARPSEAIDIGDREYPPEAIGSLHGRLDVDNGYYLGLGYGNAARTAGHWSFSFDLGVVFQEYTVDLKVTGPIAGLPQFQDDLEKERRDIQDALDDFPFYPVLMFGVAYRF